VTIRSACGVFASPARSSYTGSTDPTRPDALSKPWREAPLQTRLTIVLALCALLAWPALAQQPPGMSMESSQALFSVMAAINELKAAAEKGLQQQHQTPAKRPVE
jgi:hypothetical protein